MAIQKPNQNQSNQDNAQTTPNAQANFDENLEAFANTQEFTDDAQYNGGNQYNQGGYQQNQYTQGNPAGPTLDLSSLLRRSIDVGATDKRAQELIETFNEKILKSPSKVLSVDLHLIEVDAMRSELPFSAVVAYHEVPDTAGNIMYVAYSTLIIADDADLGYQDTRFGGGTLPLPRVAFNEYDVMYDETIRNVLKRQFAGQADAPVFVFSGVAILHHEVELQDEQQVIRVLAGLGDMCVSAVLDETLDPTADPNTSLHDVIKTQGYQLQAQINHHPKDIHHPDGTISHCDVMISTKATRQRRSHAPQNYQANAPITRSIVDVGITMDLLYVGQQTYNPQSSIRQMYLNSAQPTRSPSFLANAIITYIGNEDAIVTLATCLLGISSAMIIQADEVYPEIFKPKKHADGREELGNIGSIGYVIPDDQGQVGYIDVHSAQFTDNMNRALYALIFENIYPDVTLNLDIPSTILGSRSMKVIEKAALADPRSQQEKDATGGDEQFGAIARIEMTLNRLTNGLFSSKYWQGGPIANDNPLLVPIGYFYDSKRVKRDLREIDYLAVADFAGQTGRTQVLEDWTASMVMTDRLRGCALRINIIQEIVGRDNVFIKDYALRFMLSGAFVQACGSATVTAGISPTFNNLSQSEQHRITANIQDFAAYQLNQQHGNAYANQTRYQHNYTNGTQFNRYSAFR